MESGSLGPFLILAHPFLPAGANQQYHRLNDSHKIQINSGLARKLNFYKF
jgi:hypothetical protein